ncbi:Uma2 family endonuclease [Actinoplanes couchii]|uniref:Putative restriction endonuclease domain-containing protein n=1 Tax=Actinoplanes couchii TaxID=403638 RepID=A0ABQ3X6P9_9ACTN|nr:Uma2 family endonuclease [Actinoplanes couchii]MDR6325221.1 Uma2 family endonuclease [Actinoplanes couchii]GID54075.1 hypothetical protein Aco03nite_024790 [Actinoplanes couchii]
MTTTLHLENHIWTESEYLAIGETPERIELFDGRLHVSPAPGLRHQHALDELKDAFKPVARKAGLFVYENVNVHVGRNRIPIPDLTLFKNADYDDDLVIPASDVLLVCEVMSPSNAKTDKTTKMTYYAEAGIPWYLLVEPRTATVTLYMLSGAKYVEHASAEPGELLELVEPVAVTIDPADLLPPR